jgi:hypothetical protein
VIQMGRSCLQLGAASDTAVHRRKLRHVSKVYDWLRNGFNNQRVLSLTALSLIKAISVGQAPRSDWARIRAEIQGVKRLLPECTTRHVRRDANKMAHILAQKALRPQECVVMRLNVPEFVRRRVDVEALEGEGGPQSCNSFG